MLQGSPGCGKSGLIHQIAEEYNCKLIDLRLSQCDPVDLAGFPTIEGSKSDYIPMAHFPIEGDPLPEGKDGWLLFLDEINAAPQSVQSASYKLVLDRMVGSHHLHKRVHIVAAGNKDSDNAVVHTMSTALQSRLVHLEIAINSKEWLEWAASNGIDHRISSYISFKPGALYTFSPDHSDKTYACYRTWEFANRVLQRVDISDPIIRPMLAGTLSEGVALEFLSFCKIYKELVTIEQIIRDPKETKVPTEPSVLYALTGAVAHNINKDNAEPLLAYMARFPAEFQIVCLRETVRRHKELLSHPAVQKWATGFATEMF